MKDKRYRGVIGWAVLLLFLFTQVAFGQETQGDFTVSGDGDYSFDNTNGVLTVSGGEVTVSNSEKTSQTIKLTGGKLILNGVNIEVPSSGLASPIEVEGKAEINLAAGSKNTLSSAASGAAGIHVPPGSEVTFTGGGELTASNSETKYISSCGIGGNLSAGSCGTIIFDLDGGSVTATGGYCAAGIGTCTKGIYSFTLSGSILIKRGTITAKGRAIAAGIGIGPDKSSGGEVTVTIEGGTVTATGGESAAGIGTARGGGSHAKVMVAIKGGTVTATGGKSAAGIGTGTSGSRSDGGVMVVAIEGGTVTAKGGENCPGIGSGSGCETQIDIFLLGGAVEADIKKASGNSYPLNTVIVGPDVTVTGSIDNTYTNGFVFVGSPNKTATVKGNPVFPADKKMTIDSGETLTVPEGTTLTNNGQIVNNGTVINNGTIDGAGTISGNSPNGLNLSPSSKEIIGKVGEAFDEVDLSDNVLNKDAVGGVTFAVKEGGTLPDGFSLAEDGKLTASPYPKEAKTGYAVTVTVTPQNGVQPKDLTLTFKINKKELEVTPKDGQFVYTDEKDDYAPTYKYSGALDEQEPAFSGKLGWEGDTENQNITLGTLALTDNGSFKADNYELVLASSPVTIHVLSQSLEDAYATAAAEVADAVPDAEEPDGWHKSSITLTAPTDFKLKAVTDLRATSGWETELTISKDGEYNFKYQLLRDGREESSASAVQTLAIRLDQTAPGITGDPAISNLTAVFTLTDATSGIASCSYVLDGAQPAVDVPVTGNPKELPVEVSAAAGTHTIAFTVKDMVGNELAATANFTLTDPAPDPAPDPTPDPAPQPTYYTVTLPEVEGAITDPVAGDYEVESWNNFRFYLTLAEGYANDSRPVVTTSRGETVEPCQSDGAYIIKYVRQDIVISISGILPDIPTGIAGIDTETRIHVAGGILQISVPQASDAFITDTSGRILRTLRLVPGTNRVEGLHSGIYIVKIAGEEGRKVIIR